jgi:tetratricopeptide (TPR) repeat protein
LEPDSARAHYYLAVTLEALEENDEAEKSYKKVIELDGSYVAAHANLAGLYGKMNKREEAIEAFKTALQLNPNHSMARKGL